MLLVLASHGSFHRVGIFCAYPPEKQVEAGVQGKVSRLWTRERPPHPSLTHIHTHTRVLEEEPNHVSLPSFQADSNPHQGQVWKWDQVPHSLQVSSSSLSLISHCGMWARWRCLIHAPGLRELITRAISQCHNHIRHCCLFSYDKEDAFSGGVCGFNGRSRAGLGWGWGLWDRWDMNNAFLQEKHLHMESLCRWFVCTFVFGVAHLFWSLNN